MEIVLEALTNGDILGLMQRHVPILSKIYLKRYLGGKSYFAVKKKIKFCWT
jgi:hypothetical protein